MFYRLDLTWRKGFRVVEVESDSKMAVDNVINRVSNMHTFESGGGVRRLLMEDNFGISRPRVILS